MTPKFSKSMEDIKITIGTNLSTKKNRKKTHTRNHTHTHTQKDDVRESETESERTKFSLDENYKLMNKIFSITLTNIPPDRHHLFFG